MPKSTHHPCSTTSQLYDQRNWQICVQHRFEGYLCNFTRGWISGVRYVPDPYQYGILQISIFCPIPISISIVSIMSLTIATFSRMSFNRYRYCQQWYFIWYSQKVSTYHSNVPILQLSISIFLHRIMKNSLTRIEIRLNLFPKWSYKLVAIDLCWCSNIFLILLWIFVKEIDILKTVLISIIAK